MPSPLTSPMDRAAAAASGRKTYFSGRPCPKGHLAPRSVMSGTCCECKRLASRSWHEKNKQGQQEYGRWYRSARGEDLLEKKRSYQRTWSAANAAEKRRRDAAYAAAKIAQRDAHFLAMRAHKSARYARALQRATPPWVDMDAVIGMYELAACFRRIGMRIEVDHIVPVQGKIVSGLHTADNMQLMLRSDNAAKSNRSWPDML